MKSTNNSTLKWIYKTTKNQLGFVILLIVLSAVLASAGTLTALLSRSAIDSATEGSKQKFIYFAIVLATVFGLQILLNGACRYLQERCRANIEIDLKQRMFYCILEKDYSSVSKYHSGELLNRLTGDVAVIGDAAATILPSLASMLTSLVAALAVILMIEPMFALIFSICGIIIFIVTGSLRMKIKQLHKLVQSTDDSTRSFWQEVVTNLLAVKVFAVEERMSSKSDQLQHKNFSAKMKKTLFGVLANAGYGLVLRAGYVFAFCWCGVKLFISNMSFGTFTAILQLVGQIQQPFSGISGVIPKYYAALASAERLIELEVLEDDNKSKENINTNDIYHDMEYIDFSNVSFAYDRERIFSKFNFTIKKGEFIAITGRSGIGKSTLFKLLLGVYRLDEGNISIVSQGIRMQCDESTRTLFAYVPQGNLMFSGTIRENITFVDPDADEDKITKALQISCANEFVNQLPDGIETIIGEKGMGLSEGQVQRLAIARALLSEAPIMLLDEATGSLDEVTEAEVLENLHKLNNITCIIVTHRKQALSICDKQLNIRGNGSISIEK